MCFTLRCSLETDTFLVKLSTPAFLPSTNHAITEDPHDPNGRSGPPASGADKFDINYPVPTLGGNEERAKVLYTGVYQSGLQTARGTTSGPDGKPITAIKLPHIGGHEGAGTHRSHRLWYR